MAQFPRCTSYHTRGIGETSDTAVCCRDYINVDGLMFPCELEASARGPNQPPRLIIDGVIVNPQLQDSHMRVRS